MKVSIVVPVFNEINVIDEFHASLLAQVRSIGKDFEIIYVDDGSTDGTREQLESIVSSPADSTLSSFQVRVVNMVSNYGQMIAIREGLRIATGDAIITMDADFQDPPKIIKDFLTVFEKGEVDAVVGIREDRSSDRVFKRVSAKFFYRLGLKMFRGSQLVNAGEFRLISRALAQQVLRYSGPAVVYRFLIPHLTKRIAVVGYERPRRAAGSTHYSLTKMVRLGTNSLLEYSDAPSIVTRYMFRAYFTIIAAFLALTVIGLFFTELERGWVTLFGVIILLFGALLIVSSFILRYLKLIYDQIRGWPPSHFDARQEVHRDR